MFRKLFLHKKHRLNAEIKKNPLIGLVENQPTAQNTFNDSILALQNLVHSLDNLCS